MQNVIRVGNYREACDIAHKRNILYVGKDESYKLMGLRINELKEPIYVHYDIPEHELLVRIYPTKEGA